MINVIKDISAVVGCISASIGLIVLIFKPIRTKISRYIKEKTTEDEVSKQRTEILKKIPEIYDKLDIMADQNLEIINRVSQLEEQVVTNEQDRLRSELYDCGNRCRRGMMLYPEEYEHVREIYQKYSEVLKCNHLGTLEYEYITRFYNNQKFN